MDGNNVNIIISLHEKFDSIQVAEEKLQWQSLVNIVKKFVFDTMGALL